MDFTKELKSSHRRVEDRIRELKALTKDMRKACDDDIFNNECYGDFKITTSNETFYVSKFALAQNSPVLKAMFKHQMKEVKNGEMVLHDDSEAVKAMLMYVHHHKTIDDFQLAMEVIQLAHRCEIRLLTLQCELCLLNNIRGEDAEECQALARR
ncbi:unnamed protein product [Bursaphelenchus okinawaensis]|uniref:BTB domain-containing protein n=1 Tax=Bursaphelenchus okinawaensis TaxID=465554 RepID=A0A811KG96_9BILA|nr:unnamed protein product [Bursaphelenchus okinawaensis]CAG9102558.1 unnamed protein product [Bursaphelenchus okinawaensis]